MTLNELAAEMSALKGLPIHYRRIAGNRLILYFGGGPGESKFSIGIDPPWRYVRDGLLILGSADIPFDKKEDETENQYSQRFHEVCNRCQPLIDKSVLGLEIDTDLGDLTLVTDGGVVSTFMNYSIYESWYFKTREPKKAYYVFPGRVKAVNRIR